MKHVLVWLIRVYQYLISPWVGNRCRFYPTCSEYARIAIAEHGSARGGWMAVRRVVKCHPLHEGGIDLVPGTEAATGRENRAEKP